MKGNLGLAIPFDPEKRSTGDGKVTAGITGLWPSSAESDTAF